MITQQTEQIDITLPDVSIEQLYKLALEQSRNLTMFVTQARQADANAAQAQYNINMLQAEIAKRQETK